MEYISVVLWLYAGITVVMLTVMIVQHVAIARGKKIETYIQNTVMRTAFRYFMFPSFVAIMAAGVVAQTFVDLLDNAKAVLRDDIREYWKD